MTKLQKQMFIIIAILFAIVLSMLGSLKIAKNVEPEQLSVQYKTLKDEKIPSSMNDVSIVYFTDVQYGKFENKKREIDNVYLTRYDIERKFSRK